MSYEKQGVFWYHDSGTGVKRVRTNPSAFAGHRQLSY